MFILTPLLSRRPRVCVLRRRKSLAWRWGGCMNAVSGRIPDGRQLVATNAQFAELLPWLALNRQGLVVFAHPETGHELADHRDHAIWLGTGLDLDLSVFAAANN